jgi:hypothetical protein
VAAFLPVILTGITSLCERDDLRDRALILTLREIPESLRRSEAELSEAFRDARPRILGAFLQALATALRRLPDVHLDRSPRMADFARLATAAEPGMGLRPGKFLQAYDASRADAIEASIELNPLAAAVRDIATVDGWSGTATELLKKLTDGVAEQITKTKDWPKTPTVLSNELTRIQPSLRKVGIQVERHRQGHDRKRLIRVSVADASKLADAPADAHKLDEIWGPNPFSSGTMSGSGETANAADAGLHLFPNVGQEQHGDAWEGVDAA